MKKLKMTCWNTGQTIDRQKDEWVSWSHVEPEVNLCLQTCCHGGDVLRQTRHFDGSEGAEFSVEVEHPSIAVPQLTEHASGP